MSQIERIIYSGVLPESFFAIPQKIYEGLGFLPEENREEVEALFQLKRKDHDIIIYTDHKNIRLVGIFPQQSVTAYFGYWESTNDPDLNSSAFRMLEEDAQKFGKASLTGPTNFNTFHRYRLRLGPVPSWTMFDREPVNPGYYPALLGNLNCRISLTYESRRIPAAEIQKIYRDKQRFVEEVKQLPFEIIPLTPENWHLYEKDIYELIEAIFSGNAGYKTIEPEEFGLLYNRKFAEKLCPYTASLFRDTKTGKLVALTFCHPNYKSVSGEIPDFPSFEVDYPRLKNPTMLAKSSGVHPAYRKMNLMNYSGAYAMLSFKELYDDTIFCLMKTDNYSRHFTDGIPCEKAFYALYEKSLGH
ncbi:hypothetical protein FK178_13385 [Antarcticibacterium arcticum]|uniref:GNAT family N-acetyltransferase n=1 Tax=Antarcticibacterium arcticum TaxID=2585771 RepID=A0A5B8YLQ1_9FLAO|nr:hypothetical protein [Antarcticibacterium arcticum]QED38645.1 hypothetical protein FK178_13385 [Antarcticibacterium arcticum]